METFFVVLTLMFYAALFVTMVIAAAMHSWFAFVGFLIAWLLATGLGFFMKEM